jgi:alpha-galactosidase
MFASWGVDYLKFDLCTFRDVMISRYPGNEPAQMRLMYAEYEKMGDALKATGRPIVYSASIAGWDADWEWARQAGANLWRTTEDIQPAWDSLYEILRMQEGLEYYAGPGHWNDPDMLEVGNGNLTLPENRSHFSMWAMLSAPLLAGNDLPDMPSDILQILTNQDVIALDQDPLGRQARHVYSEGEVDVWLKDLADGGKAIAILNAGKDRVSTHPFHLNLDKLNIYAPDPVSPVTGKNLWTGAQIDMYDGMPIDIGSHDILLVRLPPGTPSARER